MHYTIKAIETEYQGHLFRSRLEATWAAFFDLCGWSWEYEPFELKGWVPDFALFGDEMILVEVKPVFYLPEDVVKKISKASDEGQALLICGLGINTFDWCDHCVGWLRDHLSGWSGAGLGKYNNRPGIFHCHGSWHDRISGIYDGNNGAESMNKNEAHSLWGQAKRKTRFEVKACRS
ncbi:MAG: hypothetical protein M0P69_16995 [Bacteroidales bacterium]|nr:hypothetical protein [Bacteroidales bacterium]